MIDGYVIQNRKPKLVIKIFVFIMFLVISLFVWGINTLIYHDFYHLNSKIKKFNSYYFLEVLVPVEEVNRIVKQKYLFIDDIQYFYDVYNISNDAIYENDSNYQRLYLEVKGLNESYLIDGYRLNIEIPKESKKILNYFIE